MKRRLLTGLQSSGSLHIGNYFGALKPFADTYLDFESMLMVADLHALTTVRDGDELRKNTINAVKDYLAVGVDPSKAVIFQQSQIMEHAELSWIFQCMVSVPFLMQAHSYKDKVAKGLEANGGLFAYPMLMAADILLYDTDVVPVGEDQRQHIEYAREAAKKFNLAYGNSTITKDIEIFKEPKEMILTSSAIVPGTDGKKMSKSYKNTIPLFGTRDEIAKAVMSIVTDSSGDLPKNVYNIHKVVKMALVRGQHSDDADKILTELYTANAGKYKILKEALIDDLDTLIAPMRELRDSITDADVFEVLKKGDQIARERAAKKMEMVRQVTGLSLK